MKFLILNLPKIIAKSLNEENSASSILFLVSYELEEKKKKKGGGKYDVVLTVVAVGRDLFHALFN